MAFEEANLRRTLIIQRTMRSGKMGYRVHPYMRVLDMQANTQPSTFMEPIPSGMLSFPHMGYVFDAVEFIDPPASLEDSDTSLTRDNSDIPLGTVQI